MISCSKFIFCAKRLISEIIITRSLSPLLFFLFPYQNVQAYDHFSGHFFPVLPIATMSRLRKRKSITIPSSSSSSSSSSSDSDHDTDGELNRRILYNGEPLIPCYVDIDGPGLSPAWLEIKIEEANERVHVYTLNDTQMAQRVARLEDSVARTCLFKPINKECPGEHDNALSMVKCVTKALMYEPLQCWFCYKYHKLDHRYPDLDTLSDHQDMEHITEKSAIDGHYAYTRTLHYAKEAMIRTYIEVRNDTVTIDPVTDERTLTRTLDWFERRMASRNHDEEWKWNLFCTEFGYAPIACKLCQEKWIKRDAPIQFGVAAMNEESVELMKDHMSKYHSLSYNRYPDIEYWFPPKTSRIDQLEALFQRFMDRANERMELEQAIDDQNPVSPARSDLQMVIEESDSDRSIDGHTRSSIKSLDKFDHKSGEGPEPAEDSMPATSPPPPMKRVYKCHHCDQLCKSVRILTDHFSDVHPDERILIETFKVTAEEYENIGS